jgi:hypothetical protein
VPACWPNQRDGSDNDKMIFCSFEAHRAPCFHRGRRLLAAACAPLTSGLRVCRDVLLHPVLSELMELRQDDPEEVSPANWFLLDNARRVYTLFCKLDRDRNGTLSKQELLAWNDGGLTPIFVDRGDRPAHAPGLPLRGRRLPRSPPDLIRIGLFGLPPPSVAPFLSNGT